MKIVDLSVAVNEDTPAYPGDPKIKAFFDLVPGLYRG